MSVKKKTKTGRPKKEFNPAQVEIYGKFKATYETMAENMDVSVDTIRRRMQDENSDFCKAYKKGFSDCKLKLSEKQLFYAFKGNATLLIWLGKQYLGQTDKVESTITAETGQQLTEVFKEMFSASAEGDKSQTDSGLSAVKKEV